MCRDNGLWNCGIKSKVEETHLSGKNHHDVPSPSLSAGKFHYNHQSPIIGVPNRETKYPGFFSQHSALVSKSLLSNLWEIFHHSAPLLVILLVLVSSTFGHTKRRHLWIFRRSSYQHLKAPSRDNGAPVDPDPKASPYQEWEQVGEEDRGNCAPTVALQKI